MATKEPKTRAARPAGASRAERVMEWLQSHIERHGLKPGDALPAELEIAAAAGVARSSVREALTALKVLGIVRSRRKGGLRMVREPVLLELRPYFAEHYHSRGVLDEAMEFRAALELGLAELIFARIPRRSTAALRRICEQVRAAPAGGADLYTAERRFHVELLAASRNRLAGVLAHLYTPIFATHEAMTAGPGEAAGKWLREHLDLVEALERRDQPGFLRAMRAHVAPYIRRRTPGED
ncbi:MAG TPA: FCD domain-containing protein [Planctomycetota bacterium]|nr:FCD domain-containing protein [Planctomycetota bacterium]